MGWKINNNRGTKVKIQQYKFDFCPKHYEQFLLINYTDMCTNLMSIEFNPPPLRGYVGTTCLDVEIAIRLAGTDVIYVYVFALQSYVLNISHLER